MKLFILLCLTVTLCASVRVSSSNSLQQATQAVKNAKSSVETTQSNMKRSKSTLVMNTNREISNTKIQGMSRINDIQSARIKYIKEKAEEAKASGKNADACLNSVTNDMNVGAQKGFKDLDSCEAEAKQQFQTALQAYDVEEAAGQKFINQLDRVALECYTSDVLQMSNCMIVKVAYINMDIRQYQQRVTQMQREVENKKRSIVLSQNTCNSNAVSKVSSVSSQAIYDAVDCLKN